MTILMVVACAGVYGATVLESRSVFQNHVTALFPQLALVPYDVATHGEWYRLLTSAFLHFGPVHLGLNMLILWILGRALEPALGPARYLAVYVISALGGAAAVMWFAPLSTTAGASGAVFGLMGAYAVLALVLRTRARGVLLLIGLNVVVSVVVPGISLEGHLGGLAAGAAAALGMIVLPRRLPRRVGRAPREVLSWGSAVGLVVACLVVSWLASRDLSAVIG